jgi:hypothetical protein
LGLNATGISRSKCLKAFELYQLGRVRIIAKYESKKGSTCREKQTNIYHMREEGTDSKYKNLCITLPLYQALHITFSAQPSLPDFPPLLSPLNLTTQHHILLSLLATMRFF